MGKRQENWMKNEKWKMIEYEVKNEEKYRIIEWWKIIEIGWKM